MPVLANRPKALPTAQNAASDSQAALSELSELSHLLSTLKGVITALDKLSSQVQEKVEVEPLALDSFKSLDKSRNKLRNSIKAQDDSIWRSVDKATLADDNEAFANLFLSALSKVETAKRLCKYEDDRLFAALSIKEIVAALQGQPVHIFACDTRQGVEEVPAPVSLLKLLKQTALQMQRRKAELELEVGQMEQVQMRVEADLQTVQVDLEGFRSKSAKDAQRLASVEAELAQAQHHLEMHIEMVNDAQAKTDTTVDGLKGELQQAKAAATTAGAENLSLEIRIGNQQREYRRSLRQAQEKAKDAISQAEQQLEQTKQKLEAVEQISHNLDCLLTAEEQNSKEILRQSQAKDKAMEHLRNKVEHWKIEAATFDTQQLQLSRQLAARQHAHDDMAAQLAAKQRFYTEAEQQLADKDIVIAELRKQLQHVEIAKQQTKEALLQMKMQLTKDMASELPQSNTSAASGPDKHADSCELQSEDSKMLPVAHNDIAREVCNAVDRQQQGAEGNDELPTQSWAPDAHAQAAIKSHRSSAPPPGLHSSSMRQVVSQDTAPASAQQWGPSSRDPSPQQNRVPSPPSRVQSPPGFSESRTAVKAADIAHRLHANQQGSPEAALQSSAAMPTTSSTWDNDDLQQVINLEKWTGRRHESTQEAKSDEWAFVGYDGKSYGIVTKAMMVAFWKKKKLLSQVFVYHAVEGRKGGQQLHRFQKQWKENGELPSGLAIQALDADTAFNQLQVLDKP